MLICVLSTVNEPELLILKIKVARYFLVDRFYSSPICKRTITGYMYCKSSMKIIFSSVPVCFLHCHGNVICHRVINCQRRVSRFVSANILSYCLLTVGSGSLFLLNTLFTFFQLVKIAANNISRIVSIVELFLKSNKDTQFFVLGRLCPRSQPNWPQRLCLCSCGTLKN